MDGASAEVAVFDIGKTSVKLSAVTLEGQVIEQQVTPNDVRPGPPWRHHDLAGLNEWLFEALPRLCDRHPIRHFIASGHGSGGVLVSADPDSADCGALLPMIDYEQPLPKGIVDDYAELAGSFEDRGSIIMQSSTHQARQALWMARAEPERFAQARWYLGLPQYWAWRLSGVAASEVSFQAAQSQMWNVVEQRFSPIVAAHGWERLMAPFHPAWETLGFVRPALSQRYGLPFDLAIHTGCHDSSANFYRYQAAGLQDFIVLSTGTWIVALCDRVAVAALDEHRNMTINADMDGRPLGGALTMAGREFTIVAGEQPTIERVDREAVRKLVGQGTFALPSFGADSGQFPASAGRGQILGPQPESAAERLALAVIYMALLSVTCADCLGHSRRVVLDGSYLGEPAYAALVAAFRPGAETSVSHEPSGIAAGAALLCSHQQRTRSAEFQLERVEPLDIEPTILNDYAARWLALSYGTLKGTS